MIGSVNLREMLKFYSFPIPGKHPDHNISIGTDPFLNCLLGVLKEHTYKQVMWDRKGTPILA